MEAVVVARIVRADELMHQSVQGIALTWAATLGELVVRARSADTRPSVSYGGLHFGKTV